MIIEKINDHVEAAKGRLLTQYKQAENLKSILDAFNNQTQDLEDAIYSLFEGTWVENAEGQVLDDFGTIVGQAREGFDDDFYRILIYVKMGENVSQGETERVIDIYKIITQATLCQMQEKFPAGVDLISNGQINPITAEFIYNRIQRVVGAGIRIDNIGLMNADAHFAFLGAPGNVAGFDDLNNPGVGGEFAYFLDTSKKFGFLDADTGQALVDGTTTFGTLDDPVLGGRFYKL